MSCLAISGLSLDARLFWGWIAKPDPGVLCRRCCQHLVLHICGRSARRHTSLTALQVILAEKTVAGIRSCEMEARCCLEQPRVVLAATPLFTQGDKNDNASKATKGCHPAPSPVPPRAGDRRLRTLTLTLRSPAERGPCGYPNREGSQLPTPSRPSSWLDREGHVSQTEKGAQLQDYQFIL